MNIPSWEKINYNILLLKDNAVFIVETNIIPYLRSEGAWAYELLEGQGVDKQLEDPHPQIV